MATLLNQGAASHPAGEMDTGNNCQVAGGCIVAHGNQQQVKFREGFESIDKGFRVFTHQGDGFEVYG